MRLKQFLAPAPALLPVLLPLTPPHPTPLHWKEWQPLRAVHKTRLHTGTRPPTPKRFNPPPTPHPTCALSAHNFTHTKKKRTPQKRPSTWCLCAQHSVLHIAHAFCGVCAAAYYEVSWVDLLPVRDVASRALRTPSARVALTRGARSGKRAASANALSTVQKNVQRRLTGQRGARFVASGVGAWLEFKTR